MGLGVGIVWTGLEGRGRGGRHTGNGVISTIFGAGATVAVAVEARHGGLGEEGEGLFEDCVDVSVEYLERYSGFWRERWDSDGGAEISLPAKILG